MVTCTLSERSIRKGTKPSFLLFIDLKASFGTIDQDILWNTLKEYNVLGKLPYDEVNAKEQIKGERLI